MVYWMAAVKVVVVVVVGIAKLQRAEGQSTDDAGSLGDS